MNNLKNLVFVGLIIAVVAIAAIVYVVSNKVTSEEDQTIVNVNTNASGTSTNTPSEDNSNTYTNSKEKYSFTIPSILKDGEEDFIYLPDNKKVTVDKSLVHEINTEYCAPSGECRPTTQDFSINAGVIASPLSEVKKALGADAKTETIGAYSVVTLSMGVEGEGINYYFIALPNNHTLMFAQRYIDEAINVKYKTVKDFMTLKQQNAMARQIISSVKFN